MARRFQPVQVAPPDRESAIAILSSLRSRYEEHHHLTIAPDALEAAVDYSIRYLPDRYLPDKAIDLMDEAAAQVRIRQETPSGQYQQLARRQQQLRQQLASTIQRQDVEQAALLRDAELDFLRQMQEAALAILRHLGCRVEREDIARVVSGWTGIPLSAITEDEAGRLLRLEEELSRRVIGQQEAVHAVAAAIAHHDLVRLFIEKVIPIPFDGHTRHGFDLVCQFHRATHHQMRYVEFRHNDHVLGNIVTVDGNVFIGLFVFGFRVYQFVNNFFHAVMPPLGSRN